VSEDNPPNPRSERLFDRSYGKALKLQCALIAAAGWPEATRAAYEENLQEATQWERYCTALVEHPESGGQSTGSVQSRRERLVDAKRRVLYRRKLLEELLAQDAARDNL
jgi:hypothetical protein